MSIETIALIASAVLAVIFSAFSGAIVHYIKAIKETFDVLYVSLDSILDGVLTKDEIQNILKELDEMKEAWKKKK
jgi:hypothetical protein